jgi:hypothetical protein
MNLRDRLNPARSLQPTRQTRPALSAMPRDLSRLSPRPAHASPSQPTFDPAHLVPHCPQAGEVDLVRIEHDSREVARKTRRWRGAGYLRTVYFHARLVRRSHPGQRGFAYFFQHSTSIKCLDRRKVQAAQSHLPGLQRRVRIFHSFEHEHRSSRQPKLTGKK